MNDKMNEFIKIANLLKQHNIRVLLFGSLGLQQHIDEISNVDDIDILLPHTYVTDRWDELQRYMNKLGYFLEDLHEHQFNNGKYKVAFAPIEDLKFFAGIDIESIPIEKINDTEYLLLTLQQYLLVYNQSSKDSYRRNKNNDKDFFKIELIRKKLDMMINQR